MSFQLLLTIATLASLVCGQQLRGKESRSLQVTTNAWPGATSTAVNSKSFTSNFSGVKYIAGATLADDRIWGADNDGVIWKLKWNTLGYWEADSLWGTTGRKLDQAYDSEGITFGSDPGFAYFANERIGSGSSSPSIMQFNTANPATAGSTLTPTKKWVVKSALPTASSNAGLEALTFIPNAYLVANGFKDVTTNAVFNPANYPQQVAGGVFFAGLEQNGNIYAFVLNNDLTFKLVATISSGETKIMDLEFDPKTGYLWSDCDNNCNGRHHIFTIVNGVFTNRAIVNPPTTTLGGLNIEGFTIEPESRCGVPAVNRKWAYWANDDDGKLYKAQIKCGTEASFLTLSPAPIV